jgi:hypothetical protein
MKIVNSIGMAGTALLLFVFTGTSQAYSVVPDFNIGGVPDAGFAHVENNNLKVTFAKNGSSGYKLTATYDPPGTGSFKVQTNPGTAYNVTGSKTFSLTSFFNNSLGFTSGSLLLKGKVSGLGINSDTTLWSASLSNFGYDINPFDGSPISLGWRTNGPSGALKNLFDPGGSSESIYLWGFNSLNLSKLLSKQAISFNAQGITTVPIPAAVWLFGSALMGMGVIGRRKAVA